MRHALLASLVLALLAAVSRGASAPGPNTDQEDERVRNKELYKDHNPPFCVLDIPSARGVGFVAKSDSIGREYAEDLAHFHFAAAEPVPQAVLDKVKSLNDEIAAQNQALGIGYETGYEGASDREKYRKRYYAILAKLKTALTAGATDTTGPFLQSHSYEFCSGKYYRGQADDFLDADDPIRHIKAVLGGDVTLTFLDSWNEVDSISFIVNRNGKVRLIAPSLQIGDRALMIEDALGELDD